MYSLTDAVKELSLQAYSSFESVKQPSCYLSVLDTCFTVSSPVDL